MAKRSPPPAMVEQFCYVVEFDHMHGKYESWYGSACPKCEDYVEPARRLDPRDDQYRHSLAGGGWSFHPALEDWHPCFHGGLVGIVIYPPTEKWPWARIVVSGADDTMMARKCDTYEEAREIVLSLPCIIAKDDLLSRGFFWD